MKRFQIIVVLALSFIWTACVHKGPQVVQREGFTFIYDTLSIVIPAGMELQKAVPEGDGFLLLYQDKDRFSHKYCISWLDSSTGFNKAIDVPCDLDSETRLYASMDKSIYLRSRNPDSPCYRYSPQQEKWQQVPYNGDDAYEDDEWRIVCRELRYSGYHTWFIDKKTSKEYFFPVAIGQVHRFNNVFYFTDPARFRGLADPRVGILCDSTSSYEAALAEPSGMTPRGLRKWLKQTKVPGTIYAFGEGYDGWMGCEFFWEMPDTMFNASFQAKGTLYQIITDPDITSIAQVTAQGLRRIVDLDKRYDAFRTAPEMLEYDDKEGNAGFIMLGDTLRFIHLQY